MIRIYYIHFIYINFGNFFFDKIKFWYVDIYIHYNSNFNRLGLHFYFSFHNDIYLLLTSTWSVPYVNSHRSNPHHYHTLLSLPNSPLSHFFSSLTPYHASPSSLPSLTLLSHHNTINLRRRHLHLRRLFSAQIYAGLRLRKQC